MVIFVEPNDYHLIDRFGSFTLATTDPVTKIVHISNAIHGDLLRRVVLHELAHCVMVSYDLIDDIHRMTYKKNWVEAEEWVCNFLANYSDIVTEEAKLILGD